MFLTKSSVVLKPLSAAAIILFACSCVDEAYDLSNGIDGTVDIQGSISLPIGSTELMKIGEFLELDQDDPSSVLTTDSDGNYLISVTGEPIVQAVEIPQIEISSDELFRNGGFGANIENIKDKIPGFDPSIPIPDDIDPILFSFDGQDTDISINEELATEVTDIVKDIRDVSLEAPVQLTISLFEGSAGSSDGKAVLSGSDEGEFTIDFPEAITLEGRSGNCTVRDGHTLVFDPVDIYLGEPVEFGFVITGIDLEKLPEGQGFTTDGRIYVDELINLSPIELSIEPKFFGDDFEDIPDDAVLDLSLNVDDSRISLRGVTAVLDPTVDIEDQTFEIGELPEFISGDNVTLDLYNPMLNLCVKLDNNVPTVENSFPEFRLEASLDARKDGNSTLPDGSLVRIGYDNPLSIRKGTNNICISRIPLDNYGDDPSQNEVYWNNIIVENINDLIRIIPDEIVMSDINAYIPHTGENGNWKADDYITIAFPEPDSYGTSDPLRYEINMDYSLEVPLAFGPDLEIKYSTDFNGWNSNFSSDGSSDYKLDLKEAAIRFDFINSIPLDLSLTATPIDVDGNEMSDITVEMDSDLLAGEPGNETTAPITITLTATQEALDRFDGLRLNIVATSSADLEGVALNENQGVKLEKISATIQGGIQMNLTQQN